MAPRAPSAGIARYGQDATLLQHLFFFIIIILLAILLGGLLKYPRSFLKLHAKMIDPIYGEKINMKTPLKPRNYVWLFMKIVLIVLTTYFFIILDDIHFYFASILLVDTILFSIKFEKLIKQKKIKVVDPDY